MSLALRCVFSSQPQPPRSVRFSLSQGDPFDVNAGLISAVALMIVVFICVIMMMFSGFLIDLTSLVAWLSWLRWISAFRYALNALNINELQGLTFQPANSTNIYPRTGEEALDLSHITHDSPWNLWQNVVILASIAFLFFILAFIQLLRIKKTK